MEYKLLVTKPAERDILAICDPVVAVDEKIATKIATRIYETIGNIHKFPKIGGSVAERFGIKSTYKYFVVLPYSYIIFYNVVGSTLYINRVVDARRDCVRVLTLG